MTAGEGVGLIGTGIATRSGLTTTLYRGEREKGDSDFDGGGGAEDSHGQQAAVGVELQGDLEPRAGEGLRFQARGEALQGRVAQKEEGLERDERPLEVHAFGEGRRGKARLERARVQAARGRMQLAAELAQAAR